MTTQTDKLKPAGYDRYINWKLFIIPLGLLLLILSIPTPKSMLDVGIENSLGSRYVMEFFSKELFGMQTSELSQWQIQLVRMMDKSMQSSSFTHNAFMAKTHKWCEKNDIPSSEAHLKEIMNFAGRFDPVKFQQYLKDAYQLQTEKLVFEDLKDNEKSKALKAGFRVKAAVAIVVFVVACFVTEALPLPMVAFCIGVIALCTGIVDREQVAAYYWSDATWFIMGSLMFAVAFVKTGVDKRISLMMFGKLKNPDIKWITLVMILVISPLTMFMSDHALAAIFLPIGIMLYTAASSSNSSDDPELAKMIMITVAMACNLGGSLAPSGAARNIIMMSYTEEMFGISIGFAQWCIYCIPFLFFAMPATWLVINWRFKPAITNLGLSLNTVRNEINKSGNKWTRQQIIALTIFIIMLFCWVTENNLIVQWTGIRFGIGVFAVMGGIAYILCGVVNWRDFQTKVDWGVVWLYAGAIIFGKVLVKTGGAYWIARSLLEYAEPLGLSKGLGLLISGNLITGLITQIMADGPACAAVGPVTLAMAGIVHPGSTMIPLMAMGTAISSSFAYCLVIGTPPNAIVYASGYLHSKDFLRVGIMLWFINMAFLMLMASTYWQWLGWPGLKSF